MFFPTRLLLFCLRQFDLPEDGSTVWVRCRGLAIRDKNGKPVRMLAVHLDISDIKRSEQELFEASEIHFRSIFDKSPLGSARKQADEALRKSESINNTMVSNIGDVIVIIDQNGVNQYKSPNITKLFGYKPEELVGENT